MIPVGRRRIDDGGTARDSAARSFVSAATALLTLLALSVAAQAMRPSSGQLVNQASYIQLWPQQWKFFSNVADSDLVLAYRLSDVGTSATPVPVLHASVGDLWGLSKSPDSAMAELTYIAENIPVSAWVRCDGDDVGTCLRHAVATRAIRTSDLYSASRVCGDYALVIEGPQSAPASRTRAVVESAQVNVTCAGS